MGKQAIFYSAVMASILLLVSGCSSTGTSESTAAGDDVIDLRIGAGHTPESGIWIWMVQNYFIPEVNEKLEDTPYTIEWTEAYGGSVAKLGEVMEAVESDLLDIGYIVAPFESSKLPITNLSYKTPFSSSDALIIEEVSKDLIDRYPEFQEEYTKQNQKLLGLGYSESYELVTNFPVESLDDLDGRKIGGAGPNLEWLEPVGAVPVQAELTDAYQSLQTGVYDGVILFPDSILGAKLYEQAEYYTEVGFGSVINGALTVNQEVFDDLPEDVQAALSETAQDYSRTLAEEIKESGEENVAALKKEGTKVSHLKEKDRQLWLDELPPIPEEHAKMMNEAGLPGTELMEDYVELQEEKGYKFPLKYEFN